MNAFAASLLARRLSHVRKFRQLLSQIDTAMRVLLQYAIVGSLMLLPERFLYASVTD
jgi:hypothetical protein